MWDYIVSALPHIIAGAVIFAFAGLITAWVISAWKGIEHSWIVALICFLILSASGWFIYYRILIGDYFT